MMSSFHQQNIYLVKTKMKIVRLPLVKLFVTELITFVVEPEITL